MRTTLTLDPDVAERLRQEVRRTGKGLKALVNEALRHGLGLAGKPKRPSRFAVRPHAFGFKPGIDLDRMNQLARAMRISSGSRGFGGGTPWPADRGEPHLARGRSRTERLRVSAGCRRSR